MYFSSEPFIAAPNLVESGMKYFLHATLKQCHEIKENYYNVLFNISIGLVFFVVLFIFLFLKYKGKPTAIEKQMKEREKQQYIIEKIKTFNESRQRMQQNLITGLPLWENEYEFDSSF